MYILNIYMYLYIYIYLYQHIYIYKYKTVPRPTKGFHPGIAPSPAPVCGLHQTSTATLLNSVPRVHIDSCHRLWDSKWPKKSSPSRQRARFHKIASSPALKLCPFYPGIRIFLVVSICIVLFPFKSRGPCWLVFSRCFIRNHFQTQKISSPLEYNISTFNSWHIIYIIPSPKYQRPRRNYGFIRDFHIFGTINWEPAPPSLPATPNSPRALRHRDLSVRPATGRCFNQISIWFYIYTYMYAIWYAHVKTSFY